MNGGSNLLWACSQCTFLNPSSASHCAMCESSSGHDNIVDLVNEDSHGVTPAQPLPWQPIYHFYSPQLREVSPHINQNDHLSLSDIVSDDVKAVVLMNYLVEVEFLVDQCPALRNPEVDVLLLHGSKGNT